MDHADHVALIRDGVAGAGPRWLELGAGHGAFSLALADVLGGAAEIVAIDSDESALSALEVAMTKRFPATRLRTVRADFEQPIDLAEHAFDGLLAANSLHFARDLIAVLDRYRPLLRPGGRIVVVEYDSDTGNAWVPHPFTFETWQVLAAGAGLIGTRLVGRVPSRFLGAIYASASELPSTGG
jgi:ubiquinone/menaquinone biosynthesis C-methylase UbiE